MGSKCHLYKCFVLFQQIARFLKLYGRDGHVIDVLKRILDFVSDFEGFFVIGVALLGVIFIVSCN